MSGICGMFGFEDKNLLKKMGNVISHRGPGYLGTYVDKNVCIGHRFLRIKEEQAQPMHNENSSAWLVCDGSVYNYLELKNELDIKHRFYTNNDTEVILHLYEEDNNSFVNKLRGDFAFALWDGEKKKLILARDRLGVKPLYYANIDGKILFGSEIKSILQFETLERKVDRKALDSLLTFRFISGPRTMFVGIKKIMPGNMMTFEKKKAYTKKYWEINMEPGKEKEKYYVSGVRSLFEESIRLRLTDGNIGVYLSGGVDSTAIMAFLNSLIEKPIKTFSAGFGDEKYDELKYARIVAEHFGTSHHEIIIQPNAINFLPVTIWYFDEPMADPTAIPVYMLSEHAKKEHVNIVFVGEGADEVFGGYEQDKIIMLTDRCRRIIPDSFLKKMSILIKITPKNVLNKFFKYTSDLGEEGIRRSIKYISLLEDRGRSYLSIVSIFDNEERKELYTKDGLEENYVPQDKLLNNSFFKTNTSLLNQLLLMDMKVSLPDNLLMKNGRMMMANGIDTRFPFLDHELVSFSSKIPPSLKIRGTTSKYILKKAFFPMFPKEIRKRKGKGRFFVPIHTWLNKELRNSCIQSLSEKEMKAYFNPDYLHKMMKNYDSSRLYYVRQLWVLLTFRIWHKMFIESDKVHQPQPSVNFFL